MAQELRFDVTTPLTLDVPDGIVATSATLTLRKPSGTVVESPAVACPTAATTLAAGSTTTVLQLTSTAGFAVGQLVRIESDGVVYLRRIASIAGTNVTLLSALPALPSTGDAVRSLRLSASVAAPGVALLGANYQLEWTYSNGTGRGTHREVADVVRFPFVDPIRAHDVAEILAYDYQDSRPEGWCAGIAARACDRVRTELRARGERPHLYVDAGLFRECCLTAVAILLAEAGYVPGGSDAESRKKDLRSQYAAEFKAVAQSLAPYDADEDGAIAGNAEEKRHFFTFEVSR